MENKYIQRSHMREYTRHAVSIETNLRIESPSMIVRVIMRDINIKGAGFLSKTELAKGTRVTFLLEGIRLTGKVVRISEAQHNPGLFDIGVAFDALGYFQNLSLKRLVGAIMDGKYKPGNHLAIGTPKEDIIKSK